MPPAARMTLRHRTAGAQISVNLRLTILDKENR